MGIAREAQAEIFKPFQQAEAGAKIGGTGLGLAIAKRLLDLMGGSIGVDAETGKGARFVVEVPMGSIERSKFNVGRSTLKGTRAARFAAGTRVKALVVDDVAENRDLLAQMLRGLGCEVSVANDGAQGVEAALRERPDIVFMDIRMPGMDGVEAARRIKAGWNLSDASNSRGNEAHSPPRKDQSLLTSAATKLVCLSASALAHEEQRYRDAGFDDFIAKPFRFERICDCLERLLRVRFESATAADSSEVTPDLMGVKLPAELLGRLKEAAERFSKTRLERCCEELDRLGGKRRELSAILRRLVEEGDMRAVSRFLQQLSSE